MTSQFLLPTKIVTGAGAVSQVAQEAKLFGAGKALIVTDPGLNGTGIPAMVADKLKAGGLAVDIFSEVEADPSIATASKAAEKARSFKADVLVAVGGGSSMDAAKSAALLVASGGYLKDYAGVGKVAKPTLPVIAIPTTAGTGSEVTIFAVMSDPDNNEKFTISSPFIAPRVAILDGELTVKLPPMITACTGMDALTHAVEAYGSSIAQPATDAYAIHAIKMIHANLPVAVHRGDNLAARGNMIQASLLAGIAFNNAFLGLAHAIASPLGGHFHVSHGMANAVMLPYVMEFNLPAAMEKYANIAKALDLGSAGEPARSLAEKAVAAVAQLARDINIPLRLRDIGAKEEVLPLVARDALKSIQLRFNPRLASEQDILALLKKAY
jgi:alcohol dehydrogenase